MAHTMLARIAVYVMEQEHRQKKFAMFTNIVQTAGQRWKASMADVLIRGMEIPKNCATCSLWTYKGIYCEGYKTADYNNPNRHLSCPLIEVPDHGRLVDADALDKTMQFIGEAEAQIYGSQSWGFAMKCRKALCDTPTVIQASGGSEVGDEK